MWSDEVEEEEEEGEIPSSGHQEQSEDSITSSQQRNEMFEEAVEVEVEQAKKNVAAPTTSTKSAKSKKNDNVSSHFGKAR
ncbi:hypothetical protein K7X08_016404 [Anisodus acutangulus]|uniref:Uncharacterized protein n=1 Tax=Anisodus acutangulus TaxID=402998 RepID=A0A9Q1R005_9SOLA|nr:hypothetical protein K7X08_016404 [Anisodus acutangulus]